MTVQKRLSISFSDREFEILDRLSAHTQKPKAELVRMIIIEYLRENPNRFRRKTNGDIVRSKNILLSE